MGRGGGTGWFPSYPGVALLQADGPTLQYVARRVGARAAPQVPSFLYFASPNAFQFSNGGSTSQVPSIPALGFPSHADAVDPQVPKGGHLPTHSRRRNCPHVFIPYELATHAAFSPTAVWFIVGLPQYRCVPNWNCSTNRESAITDAAHKPRAHSPSLWLGPTGVTQPYALSSYQIIANRDVWMGRSEPAKTPSANPRAQCGVIAGHSISDTNWSLRILDLFLFSLDLREFNDT
jgi:hypothetical protein